MFDCKLTNNITELLKEEKSGYIYDPDKAVLTKMTALPVFALAALI